MTRRPTRGTVPEERSKQELPASFGSNFREVRERAGLSQPDAARRAGITQQAISDIETGKRLNLTLAMMTRLAEAVNTDLVILLRPRPPHPER